MINVGIELLKAKYGDGFFVTLSYEGKEFIIMIDGGLSTTYKERRRSLDGLLKTKLKQLNGEGKHIDLLVMTHVDMDHIGGILTWFEQDCPSADFVKRIWLNDDVKIDDNSDLNNNANHAASLIKILDEKGIAHESQFVAGKTIPFEWGLIYMLAPNSTDHNAVAEKIAANLDNKENNNYKTDIKTLVAQDWTMDACTPENDASMAFLLHTHDGENDLFLGDANIDTVMGSISLLKRFEKPLRCKWVKLSHHGSKNNFKPEFLELVTAENYVFSTNGDYYGHPDKEVVAQLIDKTNATLWFNYVERGREMITEQDKVDYPNVENRIREI